MSAVKCSEVREALSAVVDGEVTGVDSFELSGHLAGCVDCAEYRERLRELAGLTASLRVEVRPPASTLRAGPGPIAARGRTEPGPRTLLRWGIVALVVADLAASAVELLAENGYTGEDHSGHESLSFTIAICVGMIWVARRPSYALVYLPMVGVAAGLLMVTAFLDVAAGRAQAVEELPHLTLVGAFVLLWLLAREERRGGARRSRRGRRPVARSGTTLRVVRGALRSIAVVAVPALVLVTAPSWGHATLEGSNPSTGAVLKVLPPRVTLRFDESVTTLSTSLEVYGPDGARVDDGAITRPNGEGSLVSVGVTGQQRGTYLVSWRVISADSHPVSGAFTFSVGKSSAVPTAPRVRTDPTVATALGASRWLGYLGAASLVGGIAFLLVCWRDGWSSLGVRRLVWGGLAAAALAALLGFLLKGPYDAARGIGHIGQADLLREVLGSTYGRAMLARLCLLALLALLLVVRLRVDPRVWVSLSAATSLCLLASYALTGHAVSDHPQAVAIAIDVAHLGAMSVWIGGLAMLVLFVVRGGEPVEVAAPVVRRFSRLALGAVLVLVSTGTYQAWREVRSWAALTATTYGRELLVKLVLVACVIGVAVLSRRWVRHGREDLPALRRRVSLEAAGVVLVLGVTSALVATQPAASAYHPSVSANLAAGPDTVRVSAVPAGDRRMQVHLSVFDKFSRPTEPAEVDASLTLPGRSIGPLPLTLTKAGKGQRIASLAVPVLGEWTMTVVVRTTAIDEYFATVVLPIH